MSSLCHAEGLRQIKVATKNKSGVFRSRPGNNPESLFTSNETPLGYSRFKDTQLHSHKISAVPYTKTFSYNLNNKSSSNSIKSYGNAFKSFNDAPNK
jgi:hypothetical protein